MTTPAERTQALLNMRLFLSELLDPRLTPRVPRAVRKRASWALKHYPLVAEIDMLAERSPHLLGERWWK